MIFHDFHDFPQLWRPVAPLCCGNIFFLLQILTFTDFIYRFLSTVFNIITNFFLTKKNHLCEDSSYPFKGPGPTPAERVIFFFTRRGKDSFSTTNWPFVIDKSLFGRKLSLLSREPIFLSISDPDLRFMER